MKAFLLSICAVLCISSFAMANIADSTEQANSSAQAITKSSIISRLDRRSQKGQQVVADRCMDECIAQTCPGSQGECEDSCQESCR